VTLPAVGWVGIGTMGAPMAGHLAAAGFTVRVHDVDEAAVASFLAAHPGAAAGSLPELARDSEIVVTMLPDGAVVREVAVGDAGLLAHARPGGVFVDMSSSSPYDTVELARLADEREVAVVDAPVSGGAVRARDGTLAIMVSGDDAAVARAEPLFASLGSTVLRCGTSPGSAHAVKALNNVLSCTGLLVAAEALAVGRRFGLDPEVMIDVFNAGTGRNYATETKFRQFVFSGTHAAGFPLDLMLKDLETAAELTRRAGVDAPLAESCRRSVREALAALGPVDHTFLADWVEERAPGRGEAGS
jgi:3-hydroxyisobutyrate dehydrogenase